MRFSPDFIQKVQEATDLVSLANEYTELRRKGKNLMARCPLPGHADKTASFSVSDDKQVFYCFGCHGKGNVYGFVEKMQGLAFPDAVEYLARRAGLEIPQQSTEQQWQPNEKQDEKKEMLQALEVAAAFFKKKLEALPEDGSVKEYVRKRRLASELRENFGVGYAPEDWEALVQELRQKKVSLKIADKLGLVRERKSPATGYYDLFRHRLMFPILSPFGDVIGFGGRILEGEGPKYINSPESLVFNKRKTLYGLHATARFIRADDCAVIVEGYMDAIALYRGGVQNVAASLGTAFTKEHAKAIKKMTKNVVILFDGDVAGQRAAEQALPVLLSEGLYPRALTLPGGADPDDFIEKEGADALKEQIKTAPEMFDWVTQRWFEGYRGEASQKLKLVDLVAPVLMSIPEKSLTQLYAQSYAQKLSVSLDWLREAVKERRRKGSDGGRADAQGPTIAPGRPSMQKSGHNKFGEIEWVLLGLAARHHENYAHIRQAEPHQYFQDDRAKEVWNRLDAAGQVSEKFDKLASQLVSTEDLPDSFYRTLLEDAGDRGGEIKLVGDCLRGLKERHWRAQGTQLAVELKAQFDEKKLEEYVNVQRMRLLEKRGRPVSDTDKE